MTLMMMMKMLTRKLDEDVDKKANLDESVAEAENIDNPFLRPVHMPRTAKTTAK